MKSLQILVTLLMAMSFIATFAVAREHNKVKQREGKLFSLFSIVNFKNDPCVSSSSIASGSTSYRNGTCFTASECSSKGGSSKGGCASGFGVCCVFMLSDSSSTTVNYNDTYLQNPSYPSTYGSTSSLSYTVNKVQSDVCWLRLDFETFTITGPVTTEDLGGKCSSDKFVVTVTSGQQIPEICGDNTGQHIYVNMGAGASDSAGLAFSFTGSSTSRKWEIKTAQIPCGSNYAPRDGCLQWHTGLTGSMSTFNFNSASGNHLALQNYEICVRQEQGYCCIEYSVCGTDLSNFSLNNVVALIQDTAKSVVGSVCFATTTGVASDTTADYIVIEGSGAGCNADPSNSRYCGNILHSQADSKISIPICDCTAPFYVGIHTDEKEDTKSVDSIDRGVCLNYQQIPC